MIGYLEPWIHTMFAHRHPRVCITTMIALNTICNLGYVLSTCPVICILGSVPTHGHPNDNQLESPREAIFLSFIFNDCWLKNIIINY